MRKITLFTSGQEKVTYLSFDYVNLDCQDARSCVHNVLVKDPVRLRKHLSVPSCTHGELGQGMPTASSIVPLSFETKRNFQNHFVILWDIVVSER